MAKNWNDGSGWQKGTEANSYSSNRGSSSSSKGSSGNKTITNTYNGKTTSYVVDSSGKKVSGSTSTSTSSGSSGNKPTVNYNSGNGYTNRETAYTWNDNGVNKTTYSNATRYEDALKEAVANGTLSQGAKLSSAVTYSKGSAGDSRYNSAESADKNGNKMGSTAIYSSLKPSGTSYANALSNEMAAANENNMSSQKALSDLYNYYNGLGTADKDYLKGSTNSELVDYLNQIDAGYLKPKNIAELETNPNGEWLPGASGPPSLPDIVASYKAAEAGYTGNNPYKYVGNAAINTNTGVTSTPMTAYTPTAAVGTSPTLDALYQQYYKPTELEIPEYEGLTQKDIQNLYDDLIGNIQDTQQGYLDTLKNKYNAAVSDQNNAYEAQARANYLNFLANQNNAKLSLASSGAKGGLGQTLISNIANNYATNANAAASDNQKALRDLYNDYQSTYAETANNFQQTLSTVQQNMIGYLQSAAEAQNSYNQWVAQAKRSATVEDRNFALQKAQAYLDQYNANRTAAEQAYEFAQQMQYQQDSFAYQKEQDTLDNAYKAAENGDFSKLKALGYNTTNLEKMYQANLLGATLDNQYKQAQINSLLSPKVSGSGNRSKTKKTKKTKLDNNNTSSQSSSAIVKAKTQPLSNTTPNYVTDILGNKTNAQQAKANKMLNNASSRFSNTESGKNAFKNYVDRMVEQGKFTQKNFETWQNSL